jgi:hypothetical protein
MQMAMQLPYLANFSLSCIIDSLNGSLDLIVSLSIFEQSTLKLLCLWWQGLESRSSRIIGKLFPCDEPDECYRE